MERQNVYQIMQCCDNQKCKIHETQLSKVAVEFLEESWCPVALKNLSFLERFPSFVIEEQFFLVNLIL